MYQLAKNEVDDLPVWSEILLRVFYVDVLILVTILRVFAFKAKFQCICLRGNLAANFSSGASISLAYWLACLKRIGSLISISMTLVTLRKRLDWLWILPLISCCFRFLLFSSHRSRPDVRSYNQYRDCMIRLPFYWGGNILAEAHFLFLSFKALRFY